MIQKKIYIPVILVLWHALNLFVLKLLFPYTGLGFAVYLPISFVIPVGFALLLILLKGNNAAIVLALIANLILNVLYFPADTLEQSPMEKLKREFGIQN
jgi:hypothetical protein